MTPEQQEHVAELVYEFGNAIREKYSRGQKEHGGNMWLKRGMLKEAKAEVIDQWTYILTIERQIRERDPELAKFLLDE